MAVIKPVAEWGYLEASVAPAADLVRDHETVRKLVEEGDHWLGGKGWLGHRTGDPAVDARIRLNVEPQFVADDVTGEMVENRSNGLLEQEADVVLQPLEPPASDEAKQEQTKQAAAGMAALSAWWDRKKFWDMVAKAVDRISCYKRGNLRAYVAEGNLTNGTLPSGLTLAQALDIIEIDAPAPTAAVIVKDVKTQREAAVVLTTINDQKRAEIWTVDPTTKATTVRMMGDGVEANAVPITLQLGGRLPLGEARGPRIVTETERQMQYLLNFITTVVGRAVETAGARERYIANAEPPVLWLAQKPTGVPIVKTDDSTGTTLYAVQVPPLIGAGILTALKGLPTVTQTLSGGSQETFATPTVTALDPVDPVFATNAAKEVRKAIYKRGKQGHLAADTVAESSGVAYQQSRAQFGQDLKRLKGPVEGMIRDVLECTLALAALMSNEARALLDVFRFAVTLHITAGPVTPDEQRLATELRDKGAISTQTMMARVGVEDPQAELDALDKDPVARAEKWTVIAAAINALTLINGMSAEGAAFLLGLTPEQIQVFATGQPPVPEGTVTKPTLAA